MMDVNKVSNDIGIEEFAKMLEEARAAFEHNDMARTLAINQRMQQVGYALVVRAGNLQIENQTIPQAEAPSKSDRW